MLKSFAVLLLLGGIALAAHSQTSSQMTHEETVVRNAYAKLRFAAEQVPVTQLAMEATGLLTPNELAGVSKEQRIANAQITIRLTDFAVGNIAEILQSKVTDLITPAASQRLEFQRGRHSYHLDKQEYHWFELRAAWMPAEPVGEEANLKLQDFLALQWGKALPKFQTYASYSVTVTYQGITAGPYKALFLFGEDKGTETVSPEDGTIDATALAAVMHERLAADAFNTDRLRAVPVVQDWMAHHSPNCSNSEEQGVCCDLAQMVCEPTHKGGVQ